MQMRVVIIDDEECVRYSMRLHLEALGHEVITAADPGELSSCAGTCCTSEQPCADVFFVDYRMLSMTGLDFIASQIARGCKQPASTKILFSGYAHEIDRDRVQALGCRLLDKPLRLSDINSVLTEVKAQLDPTRILNDRPLTK